MRNSKVGSVAGMSWEAGLCHEMRMQGPRRVLGVNIRNLEFTLKAAGASRKTIIKFVFLKDLWGCHVVNELEAQKEVRDTS